LRKRFYRTVTHARRGDGVAVLLDGQVARTPAKRELVVPTEALAAAIADEWARQEGSIDPRTMPLTRLVNSALDGVEGREGEIRDDIVTYAASDLLFYRAQSPAALRARHAAQWDPILEWAERELGVRFVLAEGVMPVEQSAQALEKVGAALNGLDALRLTAVHVMTTLTGSALLALAHLRGRLSAEQAWAAAHVDEDWNIEQWGADAEAAARREQRWTEMQAAARLLELLAVD
jgi:chaperone required for assembly of F1-ATPase